MSKAQLVDVMMKNKERFSHIKPHTKAPRAKKAPAPAQKKEKVPFKIKEKKKEKVPFKIKKKPEPKAKTPTPKEPTPKEPTPKQPTPKEPTPKEPTPVDNKRDEELMKKYKELKKTGLTGQGNVTFKNGVMNVEVKQYEHLGTLKGVSDKDRRSFEWAAKTIGAKLGELKMKAEEKVKGATSYPVLEYERLGMGKVSKDLRNLKGRTWQLKGKKVFDKWNQRERNDTPAYYLSPKEFKEGYSKSIRDKVGDNMTFTAEKGKNRIRDSRLYMLDPKRGFIEIPS
tara:strand:- start:2083 stop:2931 length:849 start_codon:yes stop_codon:yes gene_type:complete